MNIRDLLIVIENKEVPGQDRIGAIELLGAIRLREKERLLQAHSREDLAKHLGLLSGKKELLGLIRSEDRVDVRCQAAAVLAKTDIKSALELCNELLEIHL